MWYEPVIGMLHVGVLAIICGYMSGFILKQFDNSKIPSECTDWNKNHIMEKSLFITGALIWLFSYGYTKYVDI